jgi:FkbM family methyltransferase
MNLTLKTKTFNFLRQIFKIPLFEKILALLTNNKPHKSFFVKFIPNNYQYSKNTLRYCKRNGINYKLNLYDYIDWLIYFGIKEDSRLKLYRLVSKNDTIIDVGSNMGETIMNFSKIAGEKGEVHGFEPDRINYQRCVENLNLNNFSNIYLNNVGLGNIAREFKIKVDTPSNRGGNRITSDTNDPNTEIINIITLDDYIRNKGIKKINLIKIDVEGFELNVLKGAEESLKQFKPNLFIELDDNNLKLQGDSARDLISFLLALNYKVENADTNEMIDTFLNFNNCHYDIICHPKN